MIDLERCRTGGSRLALKFLNANGRGRNSGFAWPLPDNGSPGEWVTADGPLVTRKNGIHACTLTQALRWTNVRAYIIELDGEVIDAGDKLVARRGRLLRCLQWNAASARLFAADCAEHVLPLFEREYPTDNRPRRAIEAARALARGENASAFAADAANAAAEAAFEREYPNDNRPRREVEAARALARGENASASAAADAAFAAFAAHATSAADAAFAAVEAAFAAAADHAQERRWQANRLAHYLGLTPQEREAVS